MPIVPTDLPDRLPDKPPTLNELQEMVNKWDNVDRINDIRWADWNSEKRCEYMIFNTCENEGFRVIWQDSGWSVGERSSTY